jgi:hypothetical protein
MKLIEHIIGEAEFLKISDLNFDHLVRAKVSNL